MNGTEGGVARSFEITKLSGSSPCAIMACSTAGSLRMNSAENPPSMVDCSVIDTASLTRKFLPVLVGPSGREVQEPWRAARAIMIPSAALGGICDVGIIDLAGRPLAAG